MKRKIHLQKIESLSKLVLNVFSLISVQLKILAVVKCGKEYRTTFLFNFILFFGHIYQKLFGNRILKFDEDHIAVTTGKVWPKSYFLEWERFCRKLIWSILIHTISYRTFANRLIFKAYICYFLGIIKLVSNIFLKLIMHLI